MDQQSCHRFSLIRFMVVPLFFLAMPVSGNADTFASIEQALHAPETVTRLELRGNDPTVKHLPPGLGQLVHLRALHIQCMEALEDLPSEISNLTELEELVIDNGNGCTMNVTLPESLGRLRHLKVLTLYGALDQRDGNHPVRPERMKHLPDSLGQLVQLEELNLGRNGLTVVPQQISALRNLRLLNLEYNNITTVPDFVGMLDRLQELSLESNNQGLLIPDTLSHLKGLKLNMGNSFLSLQEQQKLHDRFPYIVFSFVNEYDDDAANEEAPEPQR